LSQVAVVVVQITVAVQVRAVIAQQLLFQYRQQQL
jgi:hypothetical protein